MRAIPFLAPGPATSLRVQDWPDPPPPGPDEVLIDARAIGIGFADVEARRGRFHYAPPFPFVAGFEVAGVVRAVGSSVTDLAPGQRVFALTDLGAYAGVVRTRARACRPIREELGFADAASVPVAYATAWHALHETGPLRPGDRVLVHSAAGGVGLAACRLAKLAGCVVLGTASSAERVSFLAEQGVDHPIDYRREDWRAAARRAAPDGLDVVLDPTGGRSIKRGLALLRQGGRVVAYGSNAFLERGPLALAALLADLVSMSTISAVDLILGGKALCGVNLVELGRKRPDLLAADLTHVAELLATGRLAPLPVATYPWEEAGRAHADLESRRTRGKAVLLVT